jgi:ankyrin repeat protein
MAYRKIWITIMMGFLPMGFLTVMGCTGAVTPISTSNETTSRTSLSGRSEMSKSLYKAVAEGRSETVLKLLNQGAEVDGGPVAPGSTDQLTPLMAAIVMGKKEIASLLIHHGASASVAFHGYTARDFAFLLHYTDLCFLMDQRGAQ